MASNEPTGDNRRIGAVRKRTQLKGKFKQASGIVQFPTARRAS